MAGNLKPAAHHPISVLFVCTGNICRSPIAEAIFKDMVARAGLADQIRVDSAGAEAYFAGAPAHAGTRQTLAARGLKSETISRRVTRADLEGAGYIIALDRSNLADLRRLLPQADHDGRLRLLLDFSPARSGRSAPSGDVPDPYYSGDFEEVYRLIEAGCRGLLAHVRLERGLL